MGLETRVPQAKLISHFPQTFTHPFPPFTTSPPPNKNKPFVTLDDICRLDSLQIRNRCLSSAGATIASVPFTNHLGEKFPLRFYDEPKDSLRITPVLPL